MPHTQTCNICTVSPATSIARNLFKRVTGNAKPLELLVASKTQQLFSNAQASFLKRELALHNIFSSHEIYKVSMVFHRTRAISLLQNTGRTVVLFVGGGLVKWIMMVIINLPCLIVSLAGLRAHYCSTVVSRPIHSKLTLSII